jgi:DNA-binding NarL/FixJ family response regulator
LPVKFTRRQLDVLTRLWQAKPNKAIASELDMSESTVKTHIQGIMHKLGAANRTQVVVMTRPPREDSDLGAGVAWLRRH